MGAGAAALVLFGTLTGRVAVVSTFNAAEWVAGIYLGAAGGAFAFILWVLALARTTPTRVASTMTVNPIAASLVATKLVVEPITPDLIIELVAVFAGIWIATTTRVHVGRCGCCCYLGSVPCSLRQLPLSRSVPPFASRLPRTAAWPGRSQLVAVSMLTRPSALTRRALPVCAFDQSTLDVGPNSSVRLNKFIYDPNRGGGKAVLDAAKGSFRFSTGAQGGNHNIQIKTRLGRWAFAAD